MPVPFRTYVAREAIVIAAFNAAVNAAYTWYLWRSIEPLRLFGPNGIMLDLALTPVVIAVLCTLLGTSMARRKILDGRVAVGPRPAGRGILSHLPQGLIPRAAVAATGAAALLGLPLLALIQATGDGTLTLAGAVAIKVLITIPATLAIVPAVLGAALADAERAARRPALA